MTLQSVFSTGHALVWDSAGAHLRGSVPDLECWNCEGPAKSQEVSHSSEGHPGCTEEYTAAPEARGKVPSRKCKTFNPAAQCVFQDYLMRGAWLLMEGLWCRVT